jgi:uncharacterized protein YjdB
MRRLVGILAVISVACGGSSEPSIASIAVQSTGGAPLLTAVGATVQLSASAKDAAGSPVADAGAFGWASSDATVAVVDASGLVTAVRNGSAAITASSGAIQSPPFAITVAQATHGVSVQPGSQSIGPGVSFTFTAQSLDANGHPVQGAAAVAWTIDDASIASVGASSGVVSANPQITSVLTTTVHASSGGFSGSAALTVDPAMAPVASVTMSRAQASLGSLSDTVQLSASALNQAGNPVPRVAFAWSSDHPDFATVDENGLVTAAGNGTANITAAGGGKSGSVAVTVQQVLAEVVLTQPSSTALDSLDATLQLSAAANDARHHRIAGAALTWSSSDAAVATVDGTGLVTATGNGQATISAQSGSFHDQAVVTVQQVVRSVAVSPGTISIAPDTAQDFVAVPVDAHAHPVAAPPVVWSTNVPCANPQSNACVDIDANGHAVARFFSAALPVKITATVPGASGSATLVVDPALTPVAQVVVTGGGISLPSVGATTQLSAQAEDTVGHPLPGHPISWSVQDGTSDVVTVGPTGLVTAVGNGQKTILASTNGVAGAAVVTVAQVLASIRVSTAGPGPALVTSLGDTLALKATGFDARNNAIPGGAFAWRIDAPTVATVDQGGIVTAVKNGAANVFASVGSIESSPGFTVTVQQAVDHILVTSAGSTTLTSLRESVQLTAAAFDRRGNPVTTTFVWSPATGAAATVNAAGLVTAVSNGTTNIQAASGSVIGALPVTVAQVPVSVVVSGPTTLTAFEQKVQFTAIAADAGGSAVPGRTFSWLSDSPSVVSVDAASGTVTAGHLNASANISAFDGAIASAPFTVTVAQTLALVGVTTSLPGGSTTLTSLGQTMQLTATANDANGFALVPQPNAPTSWALAAGGGGNPIALNASTGLVTAQNNGGPVNVTATIKGKAGTIGISVQQQIATVEIAPTAGTISLAAGQSVAFQATPKDARGNSVHSAAGAVWSSSNPAVASISASGIASGLTAGAVTITATITDPLAGSGIATANLTVNP